MQVPSTALAVQPVRAIDAYVPSSLDDAMKLATWIAKSKLFPGLDTPEAIFVVMMRAAEMGLPISIPLTEMRMVKGRLCTSSQLLESMALGDPSVEYFRLIESTTDKATYAAKRRGDPEIVHTFTIQDATAAKLVDRGDNKSDNNWNRYLRVMLRRACARELARIISPARTLGLRTKEEIDAITGEDRPAPVEPLPEAKPSTVVDAEFTEVDDEQRVIRLFDGATSAAAVAEIAKEALAIWPSGRPEMVRTAYTAAKARTAPRERQPGEEG